MTKSFKAYICFTFSVIIGMIIRYSCANFSIIRYNYNEYGIAVHKDWPTYGLPVAEYVAILNMLNQTNYTRASNQVNLFLDQSLQDAIARYTSVGLKDRNQIRDLLLIGARHRELHPRPLTTNNVPEFVFWNRNNQLAQDEFLIGLLSEIRNNSSVSE